MARADRSPSAEPAGSWIRIFSSSSEAERARRPTDGVLLILASLLLGLGIVVGTAAEDTESLVASLVQSLPLALDGLWQIAADLAVLWAVVLVVVAGVARARRGLVRDQLLAASLAAAIAVVGHRVVEGAWPGVDWALAGGPPATFPAARLAVATAVIVTAAPHLSRPLRYAGRWILTLSAIGTVFIQASETGGVVASLLIGAIAGATVHLVYGSPGGRPSLGDVAAAVRELGVDARTLRPAELQPAGVWTVLGEDPSGRPLEIKVYGRDAWDSQLVTQTWRFLWYRRSSAPLRLSRERQVEHEALLLLLARGAGVEVPHVRAVGRSRAGDTVLVLAPVAEIGGTGELTALWAALEDAHAAGVSPCSIDTADLGWSPTGGGVLNRWAEGTAAPDEAQRRLDQAQLLVATTVLAGQEAAIAAALTALGEQDTAAVVPYLQVSTVPAAMRREVEDLDDVIEALRAELADRLGIESPDLVQLHRVTVGSVVQMVLLVLVGSALISGVAGLDFESVRDEVANLAIGGVVVCLLMAQISRASGAVSTLGASPVPLPLGPVTQLQFAIAYINLAVPSAVGRLAMTMRFFSRVGASAGAAVGVGAVDSAANFVVQVGLTVLILVLGLGSLELSLTGLDRVDADGLTVILLIAAALVVAGAVVLLVPKLRRRVVPLAAQVREGLQVLRSPAKLAMVLGGNALTQVLFGVTLSAAAAATGADVGIADAVLVNTVVSLFAGLLPIPGGVGVSEAGITAGLMATGMTESAALCAALVHRLMTTYLPPIWGWFAMRSLRRARYL